MHEGIPVTAVPRTLLDLAGVLSPQRLERLVERAEQLGLFDLKDVAAAIGRATRHRGARRLRQAIAVYEPAPFTRSELERRFLELVTSAGLPPPRTNAFVDGYEIDMFWPAERFAVELDGYEHHRSRAAFERDRVRQEELKLLGVEMVRIADQPALTLERLAKLLEQRRGDLSKGRPRGGGGTRGRWDQPGPRR